MKEKIYVRVWSETDPEGNITPLSLEWTDGQRFQIDRILEKRRAAAQGVPFTSTPIRYTISLYGQRRLLFREEDTNRWFVVVNQ